jgi:DNA repair protein RadC
MEPATKPRTRRVRSENPPIYIAVPSQPGPKAANDATIAAAIAILKDRLRVPGAALHSPADTKKFLTLKLAERPHEVFCALWLDNRHRLIAFEELFRGTIDGAAVHPREVVKAALAHNAAAVVFAHNHPSQVAEPSTADELITARLRDALALLDIRTLDHIIVAGTETTSLAERGLV